MELWVCWRGWRGGRGYSVNSQDGDVIHPNIRDVHINTCMFCRSFLFKNNWKHGVG
jgi:hypothetical protein